MLFRSKLEKEIISYGKLCGIKNFTPGYSGNISARYKEGLLLTTSGSSNGYLEKKHIVYTDFEGKSLEKGKKPSSEKFLHIEIYKQRPDINFIIHRNTGTHSTVDDVGLPLGRLIGESEAHNAICIAHIKVLQDIPQNFTECQSHDS